jgi:hypothetical protein
MLIKYTTNNISKHNDSYSWNSLYFYSFVNTKTFQYMYVAYYKIFPLFICFTYMHVRYFKVCTVLKDAFFFRKTKKRCKYGMFNDKW